jgi:hypothetical protein
MSLPHAWWNRKDEGERESSLSDSRRWFRSHHFPAAHFDHVDTGNLDVFRALPQLFLGLRTSSFSSEQRRWGLSAWASAWRAVPSTQRLTTLPLLSKGQLLQFSFIGFGFLIQLSGFAVMTKLHASGICESGIWAEVDAGAYV